LMRVFAALFFTEVTCVRKFQQSCDARRARRFAENTFVAGKPAIRRQYFIISYKIDSTLATVARFFCKLPAGRVSNTNCCSYCFRVLNYMTMYNRCSARGLESHHFWNLAALSKLHKLLIAAPV